MNKHPHKQTDRQTDTHLENKEVARLDEDTKALHLVIISIPSDGLVVDTVLTAAIAANSAGEVQLLTAAQHIDELHERLPTALLTFAVIEGVDEVLQLRTTQLHGTNS